MSIQHELNKIFQAHNSRHAVNGKKVSKKTKKNRDEGVRRGFRTLKELGVNLASPYQFREGHLQKIIAHMEAEGASTSVLHNTISTFRTFCTWIGKAGMIRSTDNYIRDPLKQRRTLVATTSHCWEDNNVNYYEKIAAIRDIDARVAIQLELQRAFGLRIEESFLICPQLADRGSYVDVTRGTKGGRLRTVHIYDEYQRDVLDRAKAFTQSQRDSMIPSDKSLKQWRNRFYAVCKKGGLSRASGVTAHGLRHAFACDQYKRETGAEAPVRQSEAVAVDRETDRVARISVAHELGHARPTIASAYLGARPPQLNAAPVDDDAEDE